VRTSPINCRYATLSVGIQERLVLQRIAQEAQEKGEPIPDMAGIKEAMEDKVHTVFFSSSCSSRQACMPQCEIDEVL
jgi:hypothetical protein